MWNEHKINHVLLSSKTFQLMHSCFFMLKYQIQQLWQYIGGQFYLMEVAREPSENQQS